MLRALAAAALLASAWSAAQPLQRDAAFGVTAPAHVAFVLPDGRPAIVDPVGREVTPLGSGAQRAAFPTWSPDGERIAYVALADRRARVDVVDLRAGAAAVSVYSSASDAPIYLSWSPSGDLLAVLAADVGGLALHLVEVASGSSRLFTRGSPFYWAWSGAGDRLLVHRDVLSATALVGFTGLDAFEVADPLPDPGAFQSPALSPSERFVAYATRLGGDVRRVVVAPVPGAGGGGERRELPHVGQAALSWHPDLDVLAIQKGEEGGFGSISLLDAETGDLEVAVDRGSLAFFWSPDGRSIAYLSLAHGHPGAPTERQVAGHLTTPEPPLPRLTINLLDVASGLVDEIAAFAPTMLFIEQFLPFFDQYARSHRVWSPASDALVFAAVDESGEATVTVFGIDGSVTPLARGEMPFWNVR